jgi:hypothetical protein
MMKSRTLLSNSESNKIDAHGCGVANPVLIIIIFLKSDSECGFDISPKKV